MKSDGLVKDKSYDFALKVVTLARTLQSSAKEYAFSPDHEIWNEHRSKY